MAFAAAGIPRTREARTARRVATPSSADMTGAAAATRLAAIAGAAGEKALTPTSAQSMQKMDAMSIDVSSQKNKELAIVGRWYPERAPPPSANINKTRVQKPELQNK